MKDVRRPGVPASRRTYWPMMDNLPGSRYDFLSVGVREFKGIARPLELFAFHYRREWVAVGGQRPARAGLRDAMADSGAFIGRFPDRSILASSGFCTVHLSHDDALGWDLALKVLASNLAADPDIRPRFVHEARDIADFRHPNIVTMYDLGETTSGPFYCRRQSA